MRMFPQTSETFIANEILRVERTGAPVRIYSYRQPVENVEHECVRLIQAPVQYLPDPLWKNLGKLLGRARAMRKLEPSRFRRTLAYVARVSVRDRSVDVWKRFLQGLYLAWDLRQENVAHLHAHFAHQATQVAMLASMLSGISYSFTGHAKDVYTGRPRNLSEKVAHAAFAVTCTNANQTYLRSLVAQKDRDKVELVYHGVDFEKFSPQSQSLHGDEGTPVVLSVGRLVAKKGFTDLIEALALLRGRGVEFRALLVGEGPDRRMLEERRRAAGLDEVLQMPGACTQEDLVEIYRSATVFALPCRVLKNGDRDGIPNVLMEAMAMAVPVVSTSISGIPELVRNGKNGLLVPERDSIALSNSIEAVIRDPALARRLGAEARLTVAGDFSSDMAALKISGLFSEATAAGRRVQKAAVGSV